MDSLNTQPTENKVASENRRRFIDSVNKRTTNVLRGLKVLGNCSNPNLYEYTQDDVNKVFKAVEDMVIQTKSKFTSKTEIDFKL